MAQLCAKERLLELSHDFIAFDAGTKKVCRHNQYFGVKAAQARVGRREGGIIWHTQGSGKSLTMVWLAKWLREHVQDARVLIITDRTELDEQIEGVFPGVDEEIYRTMSGQDLIDRLNAAAPWLMCSLILNLGHAKKPMWRRTSTNCDAACPRFQGRAICSSMVDECHRTQSGKLHEAMKQILPDAMFIGFTGTPCSRPTSRRAAKSLAPTSTPTNMIRPSGMAWYWICATRPAKSTRYLFAAEGQLVVRGQDQGIERRGIGPAQAALGHDAARPELKSRPERIVADILLDMATRDRLKKWPRQRDPCRRQHL